MWPESANRVQRMIRSTRPKSGLPHSPALKSVALVVYGIARNGARRQRHTLKRRPLTKPYRLTWKNFLISSDSPSDLFCIRTSYKVTLTLRQNQQVVSKKFAVR